MTQLTKLPTIEELFAYSGNSELAYKSDQYNLLLNSQPRKEWIKVHPYIKGYNYLPINVVEYLLKKIFKNYSIEILDNGTSFNGVWVRVRVHYLHPVLGTMQFHDGIGACELQTAKGTSPTDLANINKGALSMAYPIAKTIAIKDACDHFGTLFGADLNRKDTLEFKVTRNVEDELEEIKDLYFQKEHLLSQQEIDSFNRIMTNKEVNSYAKIKKLLNDK